tara:strand:- start:867 stop:1454 length:588 start_codon:yes stop_codon:yes gene_type:complete
MSQETKQKTDFDALSLIESTRFVNHANCQEQYDAAILIETNRDILKQIWVGIHFQMVMPDLIAYMELEKSVESMEKALDNIKTRKDDVPYADVITDPSILLDVLMGYEITDQDGDWQRCFKLTDSIYIYAMGGDNNNDTIRELIDVDSLDADKLKSALASFSYDDQYFEDNYPDNDPDANMLKAECYFEVYHGFS